MTCETTPMTTQMVYGIIKIHWLDLGLGALTKKYPAFHRGKYGNPSQTIDGVLLITMFSVIGPVLLRRTRPIMLDVAILPLGLARLLTFLTLC